MNRSCRGPRAALAFALALLTALTACVDAADPTSPTAGMVFIPGGQFVMGTSPEQTQRLVKEYNLNPDLFANQKHQVVDVKPFWIDRYEAGVFDEPAALTQRGANDDTYPDFPKNGQYGKPLYAVSN